MWLRLITGVSALGLYGWRIEDPKASYAFFYDASNWLTEFVISGSGITTYARNFANMILIEQIDGFLFGIAFATLFAFLLWPFKMVVLKAFGLIRRKPGKSVKEPTTVDGSEVQLTDA